MSFLSGLTIGLFRETRDGRRVVGFGPVGFRRWYLAADAAVPVIEHRFRQFYAATYIVEPTGERHGGRFGALWRTSNNWSASSSYFTTARCAETG